MEKYSTKSKLEIYTAQTVQLICRGGKGPVSRQVNDTASYGDRHLPSGSELAVREPWGATH